MPIDGIVANINLPSWVPSIERSITVVQNLSDYISTIYLSVRLIPTHFLGQAIEVSLLLFNRLLVNLVVVLIHELIVVLVPDVFFVSQLLMCLLFLNMVIITFSLLPFRILLC